MYAYVALGHDRDILVSRPDCLHLVWKITLMFVIKNFPKTCILSLGDWKMVWSTNSILEGQMASWSKICWFGHSNFSLGSNSKGQHDNCLGCSHWWLLGPGHSRGYIGWGSCRISASGMSCLRCWWCTSLEAISFKSVLCQVSLWKLLPWCHPFWTMGAHLEILGVGAQNDVGHHMLPRTF